MAFDSIVPRVLADYKAYSGPGYGSSERQGGGLRPQAKGWWERRGGHVLA